MAAVDGVLLRCGFASPTHIPAISMVSQSLLEAQLPRTRSLDPVLFSYRNLRADLPRLISLSKMFRSEVEEHIFHALVSNTKWQKEAGNARSTSAQGISVDARCRSRPHRQC